MILFHNIDHIIFVADVNATWETLFQISFFVITGWCYCLYNLIALADVMANDWWQMLYH